MKNLRLTLGIAAFAVGIAGAFAFSPAPQKTLDVTGRYYLDGSGNPTGPVIPGKECANTNQTECSAQFEIVDGQPDPGSKTLVRFGPKPL